MTAGQAAGIPTSTTPVAFRDHGGDARQRAARMV